ncbi:MAG: FkbM family methyltransferase, partial [Longimicrobiales bacterium]
MSGPDLKSAFQRTFPRTSKRLRFGKLNRVTLRSLQANRQFEPELKLVDVLLDGAPKLCFDVGAHIGHYCYMMERSVGAARVHAFEPNPRSCAGLRAHFPGINIWPVAVSDTAGSAPFKVPFIGDSKKPTRGTLERFTEPGESGHEITQVETARLDDLCDRIGSEPIGLIKVDAEGHERKVLAGATKTLSQHQPVLLIEIEQRHHADPIRRVFGEAEAHGYQGCFFDLARCRFQRLDSFDASTMQRYQDLKTAGYVNNFIFLPHRHAPKVLQ